MNLTGPEKAAFFVLSLNEDQASPILGRLPDEDLQRLHNAAQGLSKNRIGSDVLRQIYAEFVRGASWERPILNGGVEYLSRLYKSAVGEDRAHLILRGPPPVTGPLDDVASDGKMLAEMLAHEHPQTVAAVLSQVDSTVASTVLCTLSEDQQEQIIDRMASMASISPLAIRATRDTLSTELGETLTQGDPNAGLSRVAAILNQLLPEQSAMILARIEAKAPERAAQIRREQFTFEDLAKLDRRGMQVLLREVDASQLVIALKTASDEIRSGIFAAMSSRAAETIKEDIQNLGPQRLSDVEKAQREIVETALRLQHENKLVLITGGQVV